MISFFTFLMKIGNIVKINNRIIFKIFNVNIKVNVITFIALNYLLKQYLLD